VYVVWQEGSTADIFFNATSNNGTTFITGTKNLSSDSEDSDSVKITGIGDKIYVVWRNDTTIDNVHIAVSTDGGSIFANTNLSDDGVNSIEPRVAAVGNNVYVVWQNTTSAGNQDIVFRNSTDSGSTFSPSTSLNATNLSNDSQTSTEPDIVAVGSNVYVVVSTGVSSAGGSVVVSTGVSSAGGSVVVSTGVSSAGGSVVVSTGVSSTGGSVVVSTGISSAGGSGMTSVVPSISVKSTRALSNCARETVREDDSATKPCSGITSTVYVPG